MKTQENDITHPAFGMLKISRVTTGGAGIPLHGSSILHNTYFEIRVYRGVKQRDLSRDWYYAADAMPIIELALSPMQLIDMIASMNMGMGIPCTLLFCEHKEQQRLTLDDFQDEATKARSDFDKKLSAITTLVPELFDYVAQLREKSRVNKAELDVVLAKLTLLRQDIESNLPFVRQSFERHLEGTVVEAKASIDALFMHLITNLGVEALQHDGSLERITPHLRLSGEYNESTQEPTSED